MTQPAMANLGVTLLTRDERLLRAFLAGGLLAGLAVLYFVPPADLPLPACLFRSITGHDCLTCGMTRSLHALAHGDLVASVHYHLFGPAVFTLILFCLILFASEAVRGRTQRWLPRISWSGKAATKKQKAGHGKKLTEKGKSLLPRIARKWSA